MIAPEQIERLRALALSPTWPIVFAFAQRMEAKLAQNRHKGDRDGWMALEMPALWALLNDEVDELYHATRIRNEPEEPTNEAADTANIAMMIADKVGGLQPDDSLASLVAQVETLVRELAEAKARTP